MVFAGAEDLAEVALGTKGERCGREPKWKLALESLEHPKDVAARDAVFEALAPLEELSQTDQVSASDLAPILSTYDEELPAFFDLLDRWRFLERLHEISGAGSAAAHARRAGLRTARERLARRVSALSDARLAPIAQQLGANRTSNFDCP